MNCAKQGCEAPARFILHTGVGQSWNVCGPHMNEAFGVLLQVVENPTLVRIEVLTEN